MSTGLSENGFPVEDLLRQVSRSFFLTLRVLPRSIKRPIGIAYLLGRACDTIADTALVQIARRREALLQLRVNVRAACDGRKVAPPDFGDLLEAHDVVTGEGTPAERLLMQRIEELLRAYRELAPFDRLRICKLLDTIVRGQETDLASFDLNQGQITALADDNDLEEYTYDVAGCVGEFWTEMCRAHVFPSARLDEDSLMANSIRFGKGLQFVNIMRDIPKDLQRGRCYIPQRRLSECGLSPVDLFDPASMERLRPLYNSYLQQAEDHLSAGWQYTLSIPFRYIRIRLACAWPILIGIKTIQKLRLANVLDTSQRIKLSRSEVRRLIIRSTVLYPCSPLWKSLPSTV